MTATQLHLVQTSDEQSLGDYDVKTTMTKTLLGETATFAVIGSSHYIACPTLGFYELLSCRDLTSVDTLTIPLTVGETAQITATHDTITTETVINAQPLREFPGLEAADIAYQFSEQAYTTITVRGQTEYETYHTYPEYDLALYSRTIAQHRSHANRSQRTEVQSLGADANQTR
ncbi:hypothetical protein ACFQJ7_17070 [Halovenus rubra]|uniref:Uncharacterized protein n=2 Tax=Halovenus rubra TaxID=869890 RepID=A0ACC7E0J8_9EURY|nr:hypothetical protein [Halovenus rubra]